MRLLVLISLAFTNLASCTATILSFQSLGIQHRNQALSHPRSFSRSVRHGCFSKKRCATFARSTTAVPSVQTEPVQADNGKNGAWLPIGSAKSLVGDVPVSIEVVGIKLAVWRNGTTWSVMRDVCPHRLAPLSQGRVDPSTGCIECPYHGWQFETNGACSRIPQLEPDKRSAIGQDAIGRTGATSFPVRLIGDLIWAFLPLPPGQVDVGESKNHYLYTQHPENVIHDTNQQRSIPIWCERAVTRPRSQASYFPALPEDVLPLLSNLSSFSVILLLPRL